MRLCDGFLAQLKISRGRDMQKAQIKLRTVDECSECGGTNLIHDYDTGETVCVNCGLVLHDQMINKGPEWRAFTQQEKEARSRVGGATSYSLVDKGLSTTISKMDRDALGRKIPQSTRLQMWRLRKWQSRSKVHSSVERNLVRAMAELDRLSDKLSTRGQIKENAALIYRKALEKGLVRGRSIAGIAAASLYAACRDTETPRTLHEIAKASLVNKNDVARCYRLLLRELDIRMPIADPMNYISKIAERAGISGKIQGLAIKILREAKKNRAASGKDPMGMAGAALYIACLQSNEKKPQKDIAEAAGVTEVTVRNRYKRLRSQLSLELPD
jgi:transcription initiation factor TFIIB